MAPTDLTSDADQPRGLAVVCDRHGAVQRVLRDDFGLVDDGAGARMTAIVDKSSHEKMERFLAEVATSGAAFDWELGVCLDRAVSLLHFAGSADGDAVVVVAASSRSAVVRYYDELMSVNNEQANALRAALKGTERESAVYDRLTRLNSELATVQRELTKKNLELERANQLKNQFLGMAAHDLRNPIGAIRNFSKLLLDREVTLSPERQRALLERIEASSEFMLALINDLLDLSAIESGQLRIDARALDMGQLVRDNVELNRSLATEKHIEIALDVAPELPRVRADARKVEQILNNLLSNAVKFSSPSTTVRVTVRAAEGGVWTAVTDEGPGIPAEDLEKMFRPFQRATPKSTAGERSTGLGLAIVKRLVDGHGGRLVCESVVGRGTTFSVWLPTWGGAGRG